MIYYCHGEKTTKEKHINFERYNGGMERLQVPPLNDKQLSELEELYQKTKIPRHRTRAQIVLLSAEKSLKDTSGIKVKYRHKGTGGKTFSALSDNVLISVEEYVQ